MLLTLQLQSNLINTDTEGTMGSVHINRVSVLSGVVLLKSKTLFLLEQNAKEMKEDTSIIK